MGIDGDVEPDAAFVEDVRDLLSEVVDDLYVRRFHSRDTPDFDRREAMRIAEIAVANPAAPLEPQHAPQDTVEAMRVRLAARAREELDRRKRAMGVMTYDDLLTRLDDALDNEAAAQRLRERYSVVLVDEFQDTDPVQWRIMRRAFGSGDVTLVLIGDPKQAIYAFRGADVYAYLDAAREAATRATLDVNWRSDQGLLDAYDALFAGARLGHEGIVYRHVRAAPANAAPRLAGAPQPAPLRIRVVHRDDPGLKRTRGGSVSNASAREHIASDLAADLAGLLASGAQIEVRDDAGAVVDRPRVRPGHVAVLVRTHRNAALIRDALEEAAIPAVINGAGSVFGTTPARDWLRLLEALERPSHAPRARAAALTPFLGWTAQELASADDEALEELHRRLHAWARLLRTRGVAALAETVTLVEGLPERLLRTQDGERRLTDLRHVAQLLHEAATAEHAGVTALTGWLRRQIADAGDDTSDEERSRRLESDAEAVQVLTIHRSKGLEFPIVLFPYLWEPGYIPRDPQPIFFHDPARGDERIVDVGMGGVDFAGHRRRHEAEQRGEDLRLAYVALTRAQHQAVVWWAGSWDSRNSALGRLLFSRRDDGTVPPSGGATPSDAAATARFEELAAQAPGCISVEHAAPATPAAWSDARPSPAELVAARFGRRLDWGWRRTSYSDITAGAHEARVASEPEEHLVTDEDDGGGAAGGRGGRRRRGRAGGGPLAAGRHAVGRPRRHVRARRHGSDGLRRRGPRRGAGAADRGGPGATGGGRRRARDGGRGPRRGHHDAARPAARGRAAARRPAGGPPRRVGLRAAARGRRRADGQRRARGDRCGAARRPGARRLRRAPGGSRRCAAASAATSPGASISWSAAATASPSSTTRRTGSARRGSRSAPGTTARRSSRPRCAARTTCCRRCSTRSSCTASCAGACPATTPSATSRACCTSSCGGCRGRTRPSSATRRAGCSPGARPRVSWRG